MEKYIINLLPAITFILVIGSFAETSQARVPVIDENQTFNKTFIGGAYLTFAGKFGGEVSQKELTIHKEVAVAGCAKGSKIFQFTLYVTKNGQTTSFQTKSSYLTAEMLNSLRSLSAGDKFEFRRIKVNLPKNGGVVDVAGKIFTVV